MHACSSLLSSVSACSTSRWRSASTKPLQYPVTESSFSATVLAVSFHRHASQCAIISSAEDEFHERQHVVSPRSSCPLQPLQDAPRAQDSEQLHQPQQAQPRALLRPPADSISWNGMMDTTSTTKKPGMYRRTIFPLSVTYVPFAN